MTFHLPANVIVPVRDVRVVLDLAQHPFEATNGERINANWQRETENNPALFDGRVALLSSLAIDEGVLVGRCHMVRYASFLLWRRLRPVGGAGHAYTHPVLVGSDNTLVAIRMGPRTVNAGAVYFAAGSFEEADFRDGLADPERNMAREVMEETGLDISTLPHEPGYHLLSQDTGTVLFRRYFLPETGDATAARVRAHVTAQPEPEIVGPVIIRNADDRPDRLAAQMPALINWHFSQPGGK